MSQPPPPLGRSLRAGSEARSVQSRSAFKREHTEQETRRPGLYRKETSDVQVSTSSSSTRTASRNQLHRDLSLNRDPSL